MKRENQIFTAPFMDAQLEKAAWKHLSEETEETAIATKLMREYSDKLHWKSISENRSIKWSIDLLRKYQRHIHWEEMTHTLFNSWLSDIGIEKWRIEDVITFLDEFKDHWNWDELSSGIDHPHIVEILDRYSAKLNWNNIADNSSINWTPQMVSKYEQYLASVEDIERTNLWRKLKERRAAEIIAEIFEK
ncbi:MAG: hypothetical protein SNH27_15155 [Rikenellaceae bacterium]